MIHQGNKLKYLLERSPTTRAELARLSGVSDSTIYNYFKMEEIPYKNLKKMCNVMGWKIEEFTGNDNNSAVDNPINAQYTDYIMSMDITDAQKILLLRELVALKVREVNNLQQIIEAQKQTIEALQGRLAG